MMRLIPFLLVLLLLVGSVAAQSVEEQKAAIMITSYQMSPEVLMPNDIGTITVTVKNMDPLESVKLKEASILEQELKVLSTPYYNIGRLGPGESIELAFTIRAGYSEGIFYPRVMVEAEGAELIRYQIPVKVDSTMLTLGVNKLPDELYQGECATIELAVGNPRSNAVASVIIRTDTNEVVPTEVFLGSLASSESIKAAFNFTPEQQGVETLTFTIAFKNGDNAHATTFQVPVTVTESKKSPELILTGIEVESTAGVGVYKITGDINNAGLEAARSVVLKIDEAAGVEPRDPYKTYFVGLLSPDDFSSFELDVKVDGNVTAVPLLIEYKDEEGNPFSLAEQISIESQPTSDSGELPASLIAVLVIVSVVIVGMIAYSWKKR
jgi:hypothetical protein